MLKLSLKNIWSRKGRLVLTALAVIAGTAFLSGVFVFSDTIKASFDKLFATAYENTDAYVRSANVIEGSAGGEDVRDRVDESIVEVVLGVEGVTEAYGDVGETAVVTFENEPIGQDGPPNLGAAWIDSPNSPFSVKEGRSPVSPAEVMIDGNAADKAGVEVGDTVTIATRREQRDFTVVGLADFANGGSLGGATFALFELDTAQEFVLGDPTKLSNVVVVGDGSETQEALAERIERALADDSIEVLTGAEIIEENQSAMQENLSFFTVFLTIFAAIALFVGSFVIYNVFSISAAQREKENALLRAVGASRRQVTRSMFIEAFVVGTSGSILGCAGGVGLAWVILAGLNAVGFGPGDTALEVLPGGFITTIIVGVTVTLLCAVIPALRAGRVPPLAAMRDVAIDRAAMSTGRKVVGGLSLVVAVAATAAGLSGEALWLGLGVAALYTALIALGPFVASPIAKLASPVLSTLRGASGTMAGRNAARNPKRTALTAGALAVGLSLVIGVATLGSSAKASIREVLGESFVGDYIVTPKNQQTGAVPAAMTEELAATGVGEVFAVGFTTVVIEDDTKGSLVVAIDPDGAQDLFTFDFTEGSFADLTTDGVLLLDDKAKSLGLDVGDALTVSLVDGQVHELKVEGLYSTDGYSDVLLHRGTITGAAAAQLYDVQVYIKATDGQSEATTAALQAVADEYPTVKLQSRDGFIDATDDAIDGFLNFIYGLLGMSIFIAAIGIVITLWLSVWERRRELGLLRAVGMTKRQVRSSVLWESIVTGVVGVVLGTVLGSALGWIIVKSFEDDGLGVFKMPIGTIAVAAVLVFVLAALAAFIPARKGANANMLEAIATT